jgi:hypothetical protein
MPDVTLPFAAWAAIGLAIAGAVGALFRALMHSHATIVALNTERIAEARENVRAFSASRHELATRKGIASEPPPTEDEWDELSSASLLERERAERVKLASVVKDYHPSRPPTRYRMKSRPDR